jgi:hypothetical protein
MIMPKILDLLKNHGKTKRGDSNNKKGNKSTPLNVSSLKFIKK